MPRPPDLTSAREQVEDFVASSAGETTPPRVQARYPMTFLEPATDAKLIRRTAAGLAGSSPTDFPRRPALRRTVLPSVALAVLDAAGLVAALAAGNTGLAVVAAILLVVFVLVAVAGWRFVAQDPLRLTTTERAASEAARSWRSSRDWSAGGEARGLVVAAADAAARICRTPFWCAGPIQDVQVHLDLGRELDAIDAGAHRLAGRTGGSEWDALVDRVAALTAYADQVDGFERRRAEAAIGDAERDFGTDEDEVVALLVYLNATV